MSWKWRHSHKIVTVLICFLFKNSKYIIYWLLFHTIKNKLCLYKNLNWSVHIIVLINIILIDCEKEMGFYGNNVFIESILYLILDTVWQHNINNFIWHKQFNISYMSNMSFPSLRKRHPNETEEEWNHVIKKTKKWKILLQLKNDLTQQSLRLI